MLEQIFILKHTHTDTHTTIKGLHHEDNPHQKIGKLSTVAAPIFKVVGKFKMKIKTESSDLQKMTFQAVFDQMMNCYQ